MSEKLFRAYHRQHGMIDEEEYFSLEDAVFGELTFFGSPAKDYNPEDIVFMESIGLVDKHGNDIYEGDILHIRDATAVVKFWETPPEFGLEPLHNKDAWVDDWNLSDDSERMEIIGNIYQASVTPKW